jgi:hypothetical protein
LGVKRNTEVTSWSRGRTKHGLTSQSRGRKEHVGLEVEHNHE